MARARRRVSKPVSPFVEGRLSVDRLARIRAPSAAPRVISACKAAAAAPRGQSNRAGKEATSGASRKVPRCHLS